MRPLQDVTVVALEHVIAGPFCTRQLADLGARVIKIERAEGETARQYDAAVKGISAYFAWLNPPATIADLHGRRRPDHRK